MRVLLVTPEDPANHRSGVGLIVRETILSLTSRGGPEPEVVVFAPPSDAATGGRDAFPSSFYITRPPMGRGALRRAVLRSGLTSDERALLDEVARRSRNVDRVLWFGSSWDPVTVLLPAASHAPIVHHPNDSITLFERRRVRSPIRRARVAIARYQERSVLRAGFAATVFVSDVDAAVARTLAPSANIVTVPLGIDLQAFRPRESGDGVEPSSVLFTGVMAYGPNNDAANRLIDVILPHLPETARIRLVGRDPSATLLAKGAGDARVEITGEVRDIAAEYRNAAVFAAPIVSGSGFRNKLLEAMASSLPIVTTSLAVESFGRTPPGVLVADDPAEFAEKVASLLSDVTRRRELGRAGRAFVEDGWTWASRTDRLFAAVDRA